MFGGGGALALLTGLLFAGFVDRRGNGGNSGIAEGQILASTAEQSTFLSSALGAATLSTNNQISNANVTNLQGLAGLSSQICSGNSTLMAALNCSSKEQLLATMQGDANIQSAICNLGHSTAMGFAATNLNMERGNSAIQLQAANDTCKITTAIHAEGEATRALIKDNLVQALRERVDNLEKSKLVDEIAHLKQMVTIVISNSNTNNPVPAAVR